jgi:hypothetical protein
MALPNLILELHFFDDEHELGVSLSSKLGSDYFQKASKFI